MNNDIITEVDETDIITEVDETDIKFKKENCIIYVSGGLFGDFFHQLSVIKEKYLTTGKKGILYISNKGDSFRFGLENTYKNTYDLIIKQDYIEEYKIFNNEIFDIDLTTWRHSCWFLPEKNWHYIFENEYAVDWGKNKWLDVEIDNKWNEKVLINETSYRFSNLDYAALYSIFKDKLVFIAFKDTNYSDYEYFTSRTGLNVEYYNPTSVYDVAVAINSCRVFVGVPSGFMSIAVALHVKIIMGQPPNHQEKEFIKGLNKHIKKIWFSVL
jgi:hypothetical protein